MKPGQTLLGSLLLSFVTMGCGGSLSKTEVYASYSDEGKPTYYRIKLNASGYNGEVEYRAGWFDAQAVDDLFGDVARQGDIRSELADKHRNAVSTTMKAYLDALTAHADDEPLLEQKKSAFERALSVVTGIAPAGAPRSSVVDYANKKFVLVLSNRPDEIIAAVKGQAQKRELLRALRSALSAKNDARLEVLRSRLGALAQSVDAAVSELKEGDKSVEELRTTLSKLQAESEVTP